MKELSAAGRYRKGRTFEYACADALAAVGWRTVRAAGSKGETKADLVAFHPSGLVALVQCKADDSDGAISAAEWDALYETALWLPHTGIALIAYKPSRGKIKFDLITGYRVPRKPLMNRREYLLQDSSSGFKLSVHVQVEDLT
jgi:Holliday junction resolvase